MSNNIPSFEETTLDMLISGAESYKRHFIDKEFLIFSRQLSCAKYYIVTGKADNYLHLTGVKTTLAKAQFFRKCLNGTLECSEIDCGQSKSQQRSAVRDKRKVLGELEYIIYYPDLLIEEEFSQNKIYSKLCASNQLSTLGFIEGKSGKLLPNTLLKGNKLRGSQVPVEVVLSMTKNASKFTKVEQGNISLLRDNKEITRILSKELLEKL